MSLASGVGSHPGTDQHDFDEAVRVVLGELPELPYLPEVPGRGAGATMVGRSLAMLSGLGADLQPAGWRVTEGSGIDHRRAISLLAQDLDTVEESTQGLTGWFKVQVAGPWTLAATVERPRGDRVLADYGLRRELAESLAEGLSVHVADVRRRVPGATVLVQVDEPALPAVLAGSVPTASGFSRHRSVDAPGAAPALQGVIDVIRSSGAEPVVHCCASDVPFDLLERAGAPGVSVDLDRLSAEGYDGVASVLEAGRWAFVGVVPSTRPPEGAPSERAVAEKLMRFLDMAGLDPTERLVVTPACGLARADPAWVRTAFGLCRSAARTLATG